MKQEKLSVLFFAAKGKANKKGEAPIFLRITYNGQRVETRIKRFINPVHWDQKKECSKRRTRADVELNEYLTEIKCRISKIYKDLTFENAVISAQVLCERLFNLNTKKQTVLGIFKEYNAKCRELIGTDYVEKTVMRYERCAFYFGEMLTQYYKVSDLAINELTNEYIRDFERFLKLQKNCAHNTTVKYLKCLKTIVLRARANGLIHKDPYAEIKFRTEKTKIRYLTKKELDALCLSNSHPNVLLWFVTCLCSAPLRAWPTSTPMSSGQSIYTRTMRETNGYIRLARNWTMIFLPCHGFRFWKFPAGSSKSTETTRFAKPGEHFCPFIPTNG